MSKIKRNPPAPTASLFAERAPERRSATQVITTQLRTAIVHGRFAPGEALRQDSLARHFAVSHIPIREALRQLESEGWVQSEPNKGATVSALDAGEAREIYEMRAALECLALRHAIAAHTPTSLEVARNMLLAASRERDPALYVQRNEQFHMALFAPALRPHLRAAIEQLHRRSERYLRLKYLNPLLKLESDKEHQQLHDACAQRNMRRATSILSKHLLQTGELLALYLDERRHESPTPKVAVRIKRN
jgi:DNA-binding GntR family transcriptional regulator